MKIKSVVISARRLTNEEHVHFTVWRLFGAKVSANWTFLSLYGAENHFKKTGTLGRAEIAAFRPAKEASVGREILCSK